MRFTILFENALNSNYLMQTGPHTMSFLLVSLLMSISRSSYTCLFSDSSKAR